MMAWCAVVTFCSFSWRRPRDNRSIQTEYKRRLSSLYIGFSTAILWVTLIFFSLKISHEFSRAWVFGWWGAGLICLTATGATVEGVRRELLRRGHLKENVAIIGASQATDQIVENLRRAAEVEIIGIFDDRRDRVPGQVQGIPLCGTVLDLAAQAHELAVDRVIIALPMAAFARLREVIKVLHPLPVTVGLGLDAYCGALEFRRGCRIGGSFMIEIFERPLNDRDRLLKTCEDRIIAGLVLAFFLPIFACIAIAIKLDSPGTILFRQKRYGYGGQVFEILKFRTMRMAEADAHGENLTRRNDPRVTRVGRFLRRTSLDELPQFFNVLVGEMSIVGPRPHPMRAKAAEIPYYEALDNYALRHRVKPGITGWAQVNGWRGETTLLEQLRKRIEFDLYYIENWSLWFDLQIVAMTIGGVLKQKNVF
jgi:Undecaprenyl-phosphate glucose phosphotransferase